ncbi:hypothetical protein [Chitinilyticum litopenaei]|uniref:hypothetical protein n=1 Tax=Chitinilyticum litopenaei TaxID=1121276 RepID=UPI0006875F2A|nr:hypothetical protein [Chitinilyticum litopenaei]
MKTWNKTLAAIVLSLITSASMAAQASDADHDKHHPDASSASAVKSKAPVNGKMTSKQMMDRCNAQLKAMQGMHEKMLKAKTPEQRQALQDEHAKLMRSSMAMMTEMKGMMAMPQGDQSMMMMQKRMDMMEMMMQMMMDRMEPSTAR